jgi:hypothetical protein
MIYKNIKQSLFLLTTLSCGIALSMDDDRDIHLTSLAKRVYHQKKTKEIAQYRFEFTDQSKDKFVIDTYRKFLTSPILKYKFIYNDTFIHDVTKDDMSPTGQQIFREYIQANSATEYIKIFKKIKSCFDYMSLFFYAHKWGIKDLMFKLLRYAPSLYVIYNYKKQFELSDYSSYKKISSFYDFISILPIDYIIKHHHKELYSDDGFILHLINRSLLSPFGCKESLNSNRNIGSFVYKGERYALIVSPEKICLERPSKVHSSQEYYIDQSCEHTSSADHSKNKNVSYECGEQSNHWCLFSGNRDNIRGVGVLDNYGVCISSVDGITIYKIEDNKVDSHFIPVGRHHELVIARISKKMPFISIIVRNTDNNCIDIMAYDASRNIYIDMSSTHVTYEDFKEDQTIVSTVFSKNRQYMASVHDGSVLYDFDVHCHVYQSPYDIISITSDNYVIEYDDVNNKIRSVKIDTRQEASSMDIDSEVLYELRPFDNQSIITLEQIHDDVYALKHYDLKSKIKKEIYRGPIKNSQIKKHESILAYTIQNSGSICVYDTDTKKVKTYCLSSDPITYYIESQSVCDRCIIFYDKDKHTCKIYNTYLQKMTSLAENRPLECIGKYKSYIIFMAKNESHKTYHMYNTKSCIVYSYNVHPSMNLGIDNDTIVMEDDRITRPAVLGSLDLLTPRRLCDELELYMRHRRKQVQDKRNKMNASK